MFFRNLPVAALKAVVEGCSEGGHYGKRDSPNRYTPTTNTPRKRHPSACITPTFHYQLSTIFVVLGSWQQAV
ncbi:MAG: hypothetical protein LBG58_15725 [Planctomycetaceae bacterium]|nr:hypothetical protein [Planctomycetaceae bacterium]